MKKFVLLLLPIVLLSSCGSSSSNSTDTTSTSSYEGSSFSISIPNAWIKMDAKSAPTPSAGQLEAAWSSTEISAGFANNLVIISEKLSKPSTSRDYAVLNNLHASRDYIEYTKLDEKIISFAGNDSSSTKDESVLYTFEARYNVKTPVQKFLQTARICDDTVYLMTIGLGANITDTAKYENLLSSFTCKKAKN